VGTRASRHWALSVREVLTWSFRTYTTYAGRLLALALVVVVPVELLFNLIEIHYETNSSGQIEWVKVFTALGIVSVLALGTQLGELFYSGLVDHVVEAHRHNEPVRGVADVARRIPYWTLFVAEAAALLAVVLGTMLFVIPGVIVYVLLGLVGPLVAIERQGAWRAIVRSVSLVRHVFWRATALLLGVALVSEALEALAHSLEHGTPEWMAAGAEGLVIMLLAPIGGLVRVHMTHELLAIERARTSGVGATEASRPLGDEVVVDLGEQHLGDGER